MRRSSPVRVVLVERDSGQHFKLLKETRDCPEEVMRWAIEQDDDSVLLVARDRATDRPVGALSFRDTGRTIEWINLGVTDKRRGIGSALVAELCHLRPGREQWCWSVASAWAFVAVLGMKPVKSLPDGRYEYRWPVEAMERWLEKRKARIY